MLLLLIFIVVAIGIAMFLLPDWSLLSNLLTGTWIGTIAWFAWYWREYQKLLSWVRTSAMHLDQMPSGPWLELKERVIKLQRDHQRERTESESKINNFFEAIQASPNGVILLDDQNRIEWMNWTACEQLGIDLTKDRLQIVGNLVREPNFHELLDSSSDRTIVIHARGDYQQSRRRIAIRQFPYGGGRKMLLSTDVTQIELAESMRQQFVANVSHEIRTPLTVIIGLIETLKSIKLEESEQIRMIKMLEDHSNRMNTLVSDLLTLSRIEGTPLPDPQEQFNLKDMMTEAIAASSSYSLVQASGKGNPHRIELKWEFPEPDLIFRGYRTELLSAISNLLTNAIRYSSAGSVIVIKAHSISNDQFGIAVKDQGIGIPQDHLPRLTERFYRVDSSRSRTTGGTGLGLSIVKHVVQRHEGRIDIQSQLGSGSTFTLIFPMSRLIKNSQQ